VLSLDRSRISWLRPQGAMAAAEPALLYWVMPSALGGGATGGDGRWWTAEPHQEFLDPALGHQPKQRSYGVRWPSSRPLCAVAQVE